MRSAALIFASLAAAIVASACGATSTTTVGPSPIKCEVTLTSPSGVATAAGGSSSLNVATGPECTWTASSTAPWISGLAPASGQGPAQVTFQIASNPETVSRQADIVVNDTRFVVRQNPAACAFTINPRSATMPVGGGSGSATVTALAGCVWTTVSSVPWITATGSAVGNGNGIVSYTVGANAGPPRTGTLTIAGETLTVSQEAGCEYAISPTSQSFGAGGGSGSTSVRTEAGCAWTVESHAPWITVTAGTNSSGPGAANFTVAPHSGTPRTGTLTVAGHTFTVNQASGCSFTIDPASRAFGAEGGTAATTVKTAPGCEWTATTGDPWITFPSGASGVGTTEIPFRVAPNPSPARSGAFFVAGQRFTVTQQNGCVYGLSPLSQSAAPAGGGFDAAIDAGPGCPWTASTSVPWITLSAGSGEGPATLRYTVAASGGPARTGTITMQGHTLTVTQESGCTFTISPTSASIAVAGGNGAVNVGASAPACGWTAASSESWITVTSGASGSGNGSVGFAVAGNTGPARSGTVAIAGHTFTVNQAAGCTYNVAPLAQSVGAGGGTGSATVSVAAGCAWTAVSNDPWITVTAGASGNGGGTTSFGIAANTGPARDGTLTIAGQTFTVSQATGCTYIVAPTSLNVAAGGGTGNASVKAGAGCTWNATSNDPWITVTAGASGNGPGSVAFTVSPTTGPARNGTLTIAGQAFTVVQASGCTYLVQPLAREIPAGGGLSNVGITAGPGCAWTSASHAPWISIAGASGGSGNGTVEFAVSGNAGPQRSGTLTVAGQTVTVTQAGGCTYAIAPPSQSFGSLGGIGTVTVTTAAGCAWTAVSNASWINVQAGANGTGPGSVIFTVQPLVIGKRSGSITIAGQTFMVTQN